MISYVVGRNLGHLSPCMAVLDCFRRRCREKIHLYAYETSHRWILSNVKGKRISVKPFSRRLIKKKKMKLLEKSDLIFHDWREEIAFVKEARGTSAPLIAGMFHSELQFRKEDSQETKKFKMQIQQMANRTTDIFFHMNLLQPTTIPHLETKYVPIPIVARQPKLSPEQVKRKLGIPKDEPFIVVQMGGGTGPYKYKYMDQWYKTLNRMKTDCHIVVANQLTGVDYDFKKHIRLAPIFANGVDLINAAEMVVSKPGRGIIYDCIATGKPLLLLPADTKERTVQNMMIKQLIGNDLCEADQKMNHKDLKRRINEVMGEKKRYQKAFSAIPTNGAEIVAKSLTLLSGSSLEQLDKRYAEILKLTPFHL